MSDSYEFAPNLVNVTKEEIAFVEAVRDESNGQFGSGRQMGCEIDLLLARYNQTVTSAEMLGALHLMLQKTEWAIQNSLYTMEAQKRQNVLMQQLQAESLAAGFEGLTGEQLQ